MSSFMYFPSTLSKISHETRISLTGIQGAVCFLKDTPLSLQQQNYVQIIEASANRLLSLEKKLETILENKSSK